MQSYVDYKIYGSFMIENQTKAPTQMTSFLIIQSKSHAWFLTRNIKVSHDLWYLGLAIKMLQKSVSEG
jgi:hypothetical protein